MKKGYVFVLALITLSVNAEPSATSEQFIKIFNLVAIDKVKDLQTTSCKKITAKDVPAKHIDECETVLPNTLLSVDSLNGKVTEAWLELDTSQLRHPSDIGRAIGILIRTARGGVGYGNYLSVAQDVLQGMTKQQGKQFCVTDQESKAKICSVVSNISKNVYDITIDLR